MNRVTYLCDICGIQIADPLEIVCNFCEDTFPEEDICNGNCPTCNKPIEPPDERTFAQIWLDWMYSQSTAAAKQRAESTTTTTEEN